MSTTQDKPTAKQRQRNRKAEQRNQKSEQQAALKREQERADQDQTSPTVAPAEVVEVEAEPVAIVAAEEAEPVAKATVEAEPVAMAASEEAEVALSGEVLPPDVRDTTSPSNAVSLQTVAQAYDDYARKSWQANRFLVERLITARSFDQAIEIQGEFARQAYANFLAQSQKICELYGELTKQFFRPLDKLATGWTHIGR